LTSTTKRSHVHKETGILMTACGKNCMNHKFVEKSHEDKINGHLRNILSYLVMDKLNYYSGTFDGQQGKWKFSFRQLKVKGDSKQ